VLGLYINDTETGVTSENRLFADDCTVYRTIKSSADGVVFQSHISNLPSRTRTWQMHCNPDKCHILHIICKRNETIPSYHLGQNTLSVVDAYPYLGVTISSDLRWDRHVTVISTKATLALNFVHRNIYRCTPKAKELAHTSLACPLMEFAAPAWDPYRVKDINKLEMVQRHAARFAKSDYRRTTSVSKLIDDFGLENPFRTQKSTRLNMFGKAVGGKVAIPVDKLKQSTTQTATTTHYSITALQP